MAESKRRDNDADLSEDNTLGETAEAEAAGESLDESADSGDKAPAASGKADKARSSSDKVDKKATEGRGNPFSRLGRFIREVVAELRKVIWPTRKELLTYTSVVVVFVAVMLTIVALLDLGFAKAVLWAFGNGTKK
ncbi:preprotein translocase subunit SecE [Longispora albida]|uniref:preprotein translocase subunit SecE n=1 Tax=Longispora albida TaxID=203523 RepID=UPI00037BA106|nr:preprotein translocase subunit SecE [Longispora albida]